MLGYVRQLSQVGSLKTEAASQVASSLKNQATFTKSPLAVSGGVFLGFLVLAGIVCAIYYGFTLNRSQSAGGGVLGASENGSSSTGQTSTPVEEKKEGLGIGGILGIVGGSLAAAAAVVVVVVLCTRRPRASSGPERERSDLYQAQLFNPVPDQVPYTAVMESENLARQKSQNPPTLTHTPVQVTTMQPESSAQSAVSHVSNPKDTDHSQDASATPQSTTSTVKPMTDKEVYAAAMKSVTGKLNNPNLQPQEYVNAVIVRKWTSETETTPQSAMPRFLDPANFISVYKRLIGGNVPGSKINGIPQYPNTCSEEQRWNFEYWDEKGKTASISVHKFSRLGHICATLNYGRDIDDLLVLYRRDKDGVPVFSENGDYHNIGVGWAVMTWEDFKLVRKESDTPVVMETDLEHHILTSQLPKSEPWMTVYWYEQLVWMSKLVFSKSLSVYEAMHPKPAS
jgi:hypothetical protein